jgi:CheY-like chemotaxis protein
MTSRQSTHDSTGVTQPDASTPPLILVVDPDPDTQSMYVAGLALSGWIADAVTDGREALAKAISCRPAAIVTETRVPRLDGFELCRLLRSDPDTQHIPILVVTSDAEEKRVAAAEAAGADRVLIKPCLPDELARAIEATLSTVRDKQARRAVTAHSATATSMSGAQALSKRYQRSETTTPPSRPPDAVCPRCDRPLTYQKSYIGGVSAKHREQWDHYECRSGCGQFQYRQRTRKLRDVS